MRWLKGGGLWRQLQGDASRAPEQSLAWRATPADAQWREGVRVGAALEPDAGGCRPPPAG